MYPGRDRELNLDTAPNTDTRTHTPHIMMYYNTASTMPQTTNSARSPLVTFHNCGEICEMCLLWYFFPVRVCVVAVYFFWVGSQSEKQTFPPMCVRLSKNALAHVTFIGNGSLLASAVFPPETCTGHARTPSEMSYAMYMHMYTCINACQYRA